jgi:hypothetical protein
MQQFSCLHTTHSRGVELALSNHIGGVSHGRLHLLAAEETMFDRTVIDALIALVLQQQDFYKNNISRSNS